MKQKICVSAPGKLILLGEHAVVYGKPAIVAAIAKRCITTLTPQDNKRIEILSENHDQSLDYAEFIISQTLKFFKKKAPPGFILSINSQIPIGAGMGSSAALAVSIAGAVSLFLGEKFDKEKINNIAYLAEQKKHGLASGADNSACCHGGLLWFRKETRDLKNLSQIPFNISEEITKNFLTIFTGTPKESTKEMVNIVSQLYKKRPKFIRSVFNDQESLTKELLTALKNGKEEIIKNCIQQGEKNLELLGVVPPFVKSFIRKIEKKGGAAKICGAGGKTKGAGILLVYHRNKKELEKLAHVQKFECSQLQLGNEGVRIEQP